MAKGERAPRLAELDFLAYLFRGQSAQVTEAGPQVEELAGLGMTRDQWTDMVHHLLVEGLVQSNSYLSPPMNNPPPRRHPDPAIELAINNFREGRALSVAATHKGRVRLFDLLDQFASARQLEPLGVLFAREGCQPDYDIAQARRAPDRVIALIVLDLDHFKSVNDTLGHSAGDGVLRQTFTSIKNTVGRSGSVYRYGGDEVVAVIGATTLDEAKRLGEQIRKNVQEEFEGKGKLERLEKQPTVSVGLLLLARRSGFQEAYEAADALAIKSKRAGKNQVHTEVWS
jgi:diguanylate cyclase (GGDEF)-like protein